MEENLVETINDNQQTEIAYSQKKSKKHFTALTIAKLAVLTAISWLL